MIEEILLCLDGEEHTQKAKDYAMFLARNTGARITALHIENPYLKQFHHEIYATGRREYVAYVDELLRKQTAKILSDLSREAEEKGIQYTVKSRYGVPLEQIVEETQENEYSLVVVGGSQLHGMDKLKSGNLSEKLQKVLVTPLLTVKQM